MLSHEENELLTRVGPGTPCGELLRRYWHPVGVASELTEERPKKRVRILGEDLVLVRLPASPRGQACYGLVAEHCSHRAASLYYGNVEEDGLRCAYHGWKYDLGGRCLDQPFEKDPEYRNEIRHPAYPVEKLAGLVFAYLGPAEKRPHLPRWDVLVRRDGKREINVHPVLDCNWLQAQENTPDLVHGYHLHAHQFKARGMRDGAYRDRQIEKIEFDEFEWGMRQRRFYADSGPGAVTAYPLIFPNIMRLNEAGREVMHWRVPIDDLHTQIFWMGFTPSRDGREIEQPEEPPVEYVAYKDGRGEFLMTSFPSQDAMAWETQGPIFNRAKENLGESDRGIVKFRRMLREQIRIIQRGGEPMALVRDPEKNRIISFTTLQGTPEEGMRWVELLEQKAI